MRQDCLYSDIYDYYHVYEEINHILIVGFKFVIELTFIHYNYGHNLVKKYRVSTQIPLV